ncbi:putative glycolipid-binding domain-containing protein [Paracoccus pacificus]|uniref:Glycolipid-binding domain-containing protein n=1 Tax=Paracoccus pacificus TaxID=1463598 RepID=A0ABW4R902_9RHOB
MAVHVHWRRLQDGGTDACRLASHNTGWRLEGAAIWQGRGTGSCIAYRIVTDGQWRTQLAEIAGWSRGHAIRERITRDHTGWMVNGMPIGITAAQDVDLGFTPATNTLTIRRLALVDGQEIALTAAWLDPDDWQVKPLEQAYRRVGARYAYRSPAHGYHAMLTVDPSGIVTDYPELWRAELLTEGPEES